MKIAIIGAGNVGSALGGGWQKKGHEVIYGVRDAGTAKVSGMASRIAPPELAARDADVVALTVPYGALAAVVPALGDLDGKVVLDCTNPVGPGFTSAAPAGSSAAQQVAGWAKGARVVKIFNTTGFNVMLDPDFGGVPATMFLCADDADAKKLAATLATDLGFDPVDAGPLSQARLLEGLALLWISMAMAHGHGREMAFKLLKR